MKRGYIRSTLRWSEDKPIVGVRLVREPKRSSYSSMTGSRACACFDLRQLAATSTSSRNSVFRRLLPLKPNVRLRNLGLHVQHKLLKVERVVRTYTARVARERRSRPRHSADVLGRRNDGLHLVRVRALRPTRIDGCHHIVVCLSGLN